MGFDENLTSPPYYPVKLVEDEHMTPEFKDNLYRLMAESTVQVAKNTDKLLFGAVKQILTEHGIHNTYVLNEDFIVEAIREKMERNSATKSPFEEILGDNYDKDRLRELVEADQEGRCVVLPCRRWDILWTYRNYPSRGVYSFTVTDISTLNGRTMLNTDILGVIDSKDVGKTVFRTRKAAEAALKGGKDGRNW